MAPSPVPPPLFPKRPELMMVMGGHGRVVDDLSWFPNSLDSRLQQSSSSCSTPSSEQGGVGLLASVSSTVIRGSSMEEEENEGQDEEGREVLVQGHTLVVWSPSADMFP